MRDDLRHTHVTLALQAGMHPKVVSERLGHATVSTTLDTHGDPGYRLSSVKVDSTETPARSVLRTTQ